MPANYGNELLTSAVISEYVLAMKSSGSTMTVSLFSQQPNGPLAEFYPFRPQQMFVIEIALSICFPSFCLLLFLYEFLNPALPYLFTHSFVHVHCQVPCNSCVYLTVGMEILQAEMKCSWDSSSDYTHLLCDTDGNDRAAGEPRGQCALSSSATWQCLPSCCKEVSLLICVNEVTTLQGQPV